MSFRSTEKATYELYTMHSKVDKTENVNPNAKYIMRCTGCISPTALKSTQITSWQA